MSHAIALIAKTLRRLISRRTVVAVLCTGILVSPHWERIRSGEVHLSWAFYARDSQTPSSSDLRASNPHEPTHHAMVDGPEAGR